MFGLQNRTRTVILGVQKSKPQIAVWMDCSPDAVGSKFGVNGGSGHAQLPIRLNVVGIHRLECHCHVKAQAGAEHDAVQHYNSTDYMCSPSRH